MSYQFKNYVTLVFFHRSDTFLRMKHEMRIEGLSFILIVQVFWSSSPCALSFDFYILNFHQNR